MLGSKPPGDATGTRPGRKLPWQNRMRSEPGDGRVSVPPDTEVNLA